MKIAIAGYASLFNVRDLGGDVVDPGAFTETLKDIHIPRIRMLWQHDYVRPIGRWLSIKADKTGVFARGEIDMAQPLAELALDVLMRDGSIGLSIGYRTRRAEHTRVMSSERRLLDLDLYEISLVLFPLLPSACITEFHVIDSQEVA